MPQASRDYGFEDDGAALDLLKAGGFILDRNWDHYHPQGRKPNLREEEALQYLFEEWDFGGLTNPPQ